MAHYRRNKPAIRTFGSSYDKWRARELEESGFEHRWFHSWPAHHDVLHFRRPSRRRCRAIERAVLMERVDADEALWPLLRRPHPYYW